MKIDDGDQKGLIFNIQKFSIHDGPGIRSTVFLKGCPLRCAWCANPESQSREAQLLGDALDSRWYTVSEVMEICMQDLDFYLESGGGVTLSGGEALCQADFALALLRQLRTQNIHSALETTGYASPAVIAAAAELADLFLYDVKHYDSERHWTGTGVGNERILANLRSLLADGRRVLVRIPVIPGFNDSLDDARGFAALLSKMGVSELQLLPFHQFGDRKYELLGQPYAFRGVKPLYPEDLQAQIAVFAGEGIRAYC